MGLIYAYFIIYEIEQLQIIVCARDLRDSLGNYELIIRADILIAVVEIVEHFPDNAVKIPALALSHSKNELVVRKAVENTAFYILLEEAEELGLHFGGLLHVAVKIVDSAVYHNQIGLLFYAACDLTQKEYVVGSTGLLVVGI